LLGSQLLVAVDLPGLGDAGPDDLRSLLRTSFALLATGMVLGVLGHITKLKALVVTGIALVFAGGAFFVIAVGQFG
jgi:predicted branched-subunit amino acid permease